MALRDIQLAGGGQVWHIVSQTRVLGSGVYFCSYELAAQTGRVVYAEVDQIRVTLDAAGTVRVAFATAANIDGGAGALTPVNLENGSAGVVIGSAAYGNSTTAITVTSPSLIENEPVGANVPAIFNYKPGHCLIQATQGIAIYGSTGNGFARIRLREVVVS